jgi:hypothetical protein
MVQTCRMLQRRFLIPRAKSWSCEKKSPYNDPALMMIVKDEAGKIVLSFPFFPGR